MNVCFYAPASPVNDALQRRVENVFGSATINLSDLPPTRWKETVANADWIIADITSQNAAAAYLAGVADALGKRTILLAPIAESLPSIFAQRPVIIHQWNLEHLQTELQQLATPTPATTAAPATHDDSPAGQFHQRFGDLLKLHGYVHRGSVEFDGSTFTLREQDMDLPLVQALATRAKSLNLRVRLL